MRKPNIIFILSDDVSYRDFSCTGQQYFKTPNIDALCHNGVHFTNAYAASPECAPSRAGLMTGKHMGHCTVRSNDSVRGQEHLLTADITVAEILKSAGYATGFVGKWGIGLPGTEGVPYKKGFDYAYGFYDQARAHTYYPDFLWENEREIILCGNHGFNMKRLYEYNARSVTEDDDFKNHYDENGRLQADGVQDPELVRNSQDLIHDKGLQFIRHHAEEPFFLYYATQLPHGPCITPDLGEFKDKPWPLKNREWAAMMTHLDRHVGEIVSLLEELDIRNETVIMFAGDNGYSAWGYFGRPAYDDDPLFHNKGPWRGGKFIAREGGLRIPFFVNWPGKFAPAVSSHVCTLCDFMATAADLAQVHLKHDHDGISLLAELTGNPDKQEKHPYLYWENGGHAPQAQAARYGEFHAWRESPGHPVELYRVEEDPDLKNDLAPEYPEVTRAVRQIFLEAHEDSEWFINPGESGESIGSKRARVEREGSWQRSVRANTTYTDNNDNKYSRDGVTVPRILD